MESAAYAARRLTAVSLFSGCGGMDLGATRAGVDVLYGTDVMPEAADAYAHLLPDAAFELADVRRVNAWPAADLVLGGYPCQPFSSGGRRDPSRDQRSTLFRNFAMAITVINPMYFVAENVLWLARVDNGERLREHLRLFGSLGSYGYHVTWAALQAADFGVPQRRRRIFFVGVRKDLEQRYVFPRPSYSPDGQLGQRWVSHGDALLAAGLPPWPKGEFYERPDDAGTWPWYYMSRNRKARWIDPSFTVLANARHVSVHPACEAMAMVWSRLEDGFKQGWAFSGSHEHTVSLPELPTLDRPRRLSWRECSLLQTFPVDFEPSGSLNRKYEQIGNAVPPMLAEAVLAPIVDGSGLVTEAAGGRSPAPIC